MQRSALLVLLFAAGIALHSACAVSVDVPRKLGVGDVDKKPKAPTSCTDHKDKRDCLDIGAQEGDCAWCAGGSMPASCMTAMAAKYIPETVAKCKLPKKHKTVDAADPNKKKPKAPTSCADHKDKRDCLDIGAQDGDCAWCAGDYMPETCMPSMVAKYMPEMVAKCKLPKKHKTVEVTAVEAADPNKKKPEAPTSCTDHKDKRDCLDIGAQDGDCAWCAGGYMPETCMSSMAAKYMPEMVAKCKLPKKHKVEKADPPADKPKPKAPASCGDNTDKESCLNIGAQEGDCAWCKGGTGSSMPASCVGVEAAKWIPEQVAHCKLPKKHDDDDDDDDDDDQMLEKKHKKSGSGSGGDWPSGGGDWPSGGGDWPGPSGGGGQGQGCMNIKSKHKCLKGTDGSACAWCKNSYMGSKCVDEMTVKYMPKFIADCKMGKEKKKDLEMS